MADKKTDFSDIIPTENTLYMLKRFSKVTGLNAGIVSLEGKTIGAPPPRIYEDFYCRLKEENLTAVKDHFFKNIHLKGPIFYRTPSKLNYMGFPINFRNKPLAILMLEPFFYELDKPSDDFFIVKAQKNGFDLDKFLPVVEQVPVLVKNALDRVSYNCGNFSALLTSVLENKTEAETNKLKLKTADAMLELLSYSADKFLSKIHPTGEINELLYKISESLDIDIILVCRTFKTPEGKSTLKTYWYHSKDEFFDTLQKLTLDGVAYKEDLGIYYERIKHGQQVFGSPAIFEGRLRFILEKQGIETVLATPIFSGSILWGIMFFANITQKKDFSNIQFQTLEHIADIMGSALKREHYITLLNKTRKKYKLVSEHMSDLVWMMDRDFNIIYVSPNSQKILGYTPSELSSLNIKDLIPADNYDYVMAELALEFDKAQQGVIDSSYRRTMELEQIHKSGHHIWTQVSISFIFDKDRNPLSVIGTTHDISELKSNKALLEISEEKVQNTQKFGMDFLTDVAREIIPPLKHILEISKNLEGRQKAKEISQTINQISKNSKNLTASLESILELTRFKSGSEVLSFEPFDLFELMQDAIKKYKRRLEGKNIKLNFDYLSDLPKKFKGDPKRIEQIFSNLLINAIDNTDKGEITVMVEPDTSEKAALYALKVKVQDTGMPISDEKRKEITEVIEEGHLPLDSLPAYSGLALASVLARKMEGSLSLETKGNVFGVKLHLVLQKPDFSKIKLSGGSTFENAKILVYLYEGSAIKTADIISRDFGCKVKTVKTRRRFLEESADETFDLIMMHLAEGLAGIETAQSIRGNLNPTVPIVVLSKEKLELDKYPGVDDYLTDFENPEKIKQKLVKWIKIRE